MQSLFRYITTLTFLTFCVSIAVSQSTSQQHKPPKPKSKQTKSAVQIPIPGVGGIIPTKPKQSKPILKGTGPFKPQDLGPAPVLPPGQSLPGFGQTSPLAPAIPISRLIYGVGLDPDTPMTGKTSNVIKALGATNVRIEFSWAQIEKKPGQYDWSVADRLVGFASSLKVTPVCTVTGTTEWARQCRMDPLLYLGRFAHELGTRYKGQIKHWEYMREGDIQFNGRVADNARGYLTLLRLFYSNLRKADPSARIAVGGLTVHTTAFLESLYSSNGRPHFDALALHPNKGAGPLAFDWVDRCREVMAKHGDSGKNIWLTDWGWNTAATSDPFVTEAQQARLVRETVLAIRTRPFIALACYRSLTDSADARTGLCNRALEPRPAYAAFRELARGEPAGPAKVYKLASLRGIVAGPGERVPVGPSVNIAIDASRTGAPIPPLWEGFVHDSGSGGYSELSNLAPRMRAIGVKLVRFDPFPNPESVRQERVIIEPSLHPPAPSPNSGRGGEGQRQFTIDWSYADGVIETVARMGAAPWIDLGTMPTSLSSPGPNSHMPRDMGAWADYIKLVVRRYNVEQKRGIRYWELSDEPDRGDYTPSEWLALYMTFASAVTEADPTARVGGPSLSRFDAGWLKALIDRCVEKRIPLDFISWHASDLSPRDVARQVAVAHEMLSRAGLKKTEVAITRLSAHGSESPDNDAMPAALYAASLTEALQSGPPVRTLYGSIGERGDYRDPLARFNGRSGLFTHDNKAKAIYNAFRMLSKLTGESMRAESDDAEVHVLASRDKDRLTALLWVESQVDIPEGGAQDSVVHVRLSGLPWAAGSKGSLTILDDFHGNLKADPRRSELPLPIGFDVPAGESEIPVVMAPGSMALVELTPVPAPALSLSLEAGSYMAFGGTMLRLSARLSNAGTVATTATITVDCADPALVRGLKSKPITLKPGEASLYEFAIPIPLGHAETREYFHARSGDAAAGAVARIVPPVYVQFDPPWVDLQEPNGTPDSINSIGQTNAVIENRSDRPLQVSIGAARTPQTTTVPARSEATIRVNVPSPSTKPGNYEAAVRVEIEGAAAGLRKLPVRVPAACPYAYRRPRIDGYLTEWNTSFPILLDSPAQLKGKAWNGPADISAQVFAMWDEVNLYIAATVQDDVLDPALDPKDMADGDCLIFALTDGINIEHEGYGPGDYEIGISLCEDKPAVYRFVGGGAPGLVRGGQAAVRQDGGRTIYEAAIPWADIGPLRPAGNQRFGFSIVLHDSDGPGVPKGYLEWAGGIVGTKRPAKFIGLRLIR